MLEHSVAICLSIITVFIMSIAYTASLPQDAIYESFERVGGAILQWTPIHRLVQDGYAKLTKPSNEPFVIRWWAKDYIILPTKYLADLKTAGWEHLSFFQNISNALYLHTTAGDLYSSPVAERMVNIVRKGLNPRLPHLTSIMLSEINDAFPANLIRYNKAHANKTDVEVEVRAMDFFSAIVHQTATRIMIGPELSRNSGFLSASTSLQNSIFITALVIVKLPLGPLRDLLAYPLTLPHRWKLDKCFKILQPLVTERVQRRRLLQGKEVNDNEKTDAIEWTLDLISSLPDARYDSVDFITEELLHGLWAASSAPGGLMTQIVFSLLYEPKYIAPVREEAEKAVALYGWSEKMLGNLLLQDSFIREVNRLFPTGSVTCCRTVTTKPFTFSDGLTLPVNTRFGFPIKAIQYDPANVPDAYAFDGFRFVKQASAEGNVAEASRQSTATAMDKTNLAWGYGNHACPGRFFTVRLMKLILTKLLLEFDIGWSRDAKLDRPAPLNVEGQFVPDPMQKIKLRRRVP